jgi:hypothetical protein
MSDLMGRRKEIYLAWVRGEVAPGYASHETNDQAIRYVEALEAQVERLTLINERLAAALVRQGEQYGAEVERLTAENTELRADILTIAKVLGTTYEPDMGPVYPGTVTDMLQAIGNERSEVERLTAELERRRRYTICDCHPAARAALAAGEENARG